MKENEFWNQWMKLPEPKKAEVARNAFCYIFGYIQASTSADGIRGALDKVLKAEIELAKGKT